MSIFSRLPKMILAMGLFSFLSCNENKQKEPLRELDTISFQNLSTKAYDYLNKQQQICQDSFKISSYKDWYYDQLTGELTFSDDGVKKLIIDYEEVGSVSEETNTFLWAWANPHLEEKVKSVIGKVKDYGEKREFEKLINHKWKADQYDGWEMTAIASYLLQTKGAYRVPSRNKKLFSFMIFKSICWADPADMK